jgi:UDPglucose 6-dehydrogenase
MAELAGFDFGLLRAAVLANDEHRERIVQRVVSLAGGSIDGRTIALWGLTFKANTDDLRRSPAIAIGHDLARLGARVRAYDPMVRASIDDIEVCAGPVATCEGADVIVIATEWDEFRSVDLDVAGRRMTKRALLDTRNLLDPSVALGAGFVYEGVGVAAHLERTQKLLSGAA